MISWPFDAITCILNQDIDANSRSYSTTSLSTLSSISDVDVFLSKFNRDTAYKDGDIELSIGNCITIQDGTYNSVWQIAGFDVEKSKIASDGTVYDNGYGIMLVPQTHVTTGAYNSSNSAIHYKSSTMHTTHLPNIISNLKSVLGSHIINRNVLLSSSLDSNYYSNNYAWTISDATLMSVGQCIGTFSSNNNKYDDGEANYKLPLFNYQNYETGSNFWTRNIWGYATSPSGGGSYCSWFISVGGIYNGGVYNSFGIRPLIYLR